MWDKPQALLLCANFLYALAAVLLLYAVLFVVLHLPIFPLKAVSVEGELTHVTREQLKLIVGRHLRGNFFTLDLVQARVAFQKLPWVRNVSVRRRWPDRLEVTVEEHRELARWGDIALVNSYGELFHAASDSELPVFYGPGDGVREVVAVIGDAENAGSIRLHAQFGFVQAGILRRVGYKFDRWLDVVLMQRSLPETPGTA